MNPLTGSILQTSVVQQQQSGEKAQQLQRAQELRKNVAAREDEMEHQVENTEELSAIDADHSDPQDPRQEKGHKHRKKGDEDERKFHIDMKA
ncbi:MAG: hypothetical protein ABSF29_13150 [Tepidisphaeraceae bacterium]